MFKSKCFGQNDRTDRAVISWFCQKTEFAMAFTTQNSISKVPPSFSFFFVNNGFLFGYLVCIGYIYVCDTYIYTHILLTSSPPAARPPPAATRPAGRPAGAPPPQETEAESTKLKQAESIKTSRQGGRPGGRPGGRAGGRRSAGDRRRPAATKQRVCVYVYIRVSIGNMRLCIYRLYILFEQDNQREMN